MHPKGWVENGVAPHEQAAREAFEEAGIVGETAGRPIGRYRYDKRIHTGHCVPCRVDVFPITVRAASTTGPKRVSARPPG